MPAVAKRASRTSRGTAKKASAPHRRKQSDDATPDSALSASESGADDSDADAYQVPESRAEDEEEEKQLDSDALDDSDFDTTSRKRKRTGPSNGTRSPPKKKVSPARAARSAGSPRKKARRKVDDQEEDDLELEDGQEIVGEIVQAPTTGRVPAGQISMNTLNFLTELKKPECNDREWFKLHDPVFRLAEKEWKDFVEEFTLQLVDTDPQLPVLPPKDVIHRIYRDIRFSNDKTPYKTGFSASFSRSGRKGIFAHCSLLSFELFP